MSGRTTMREVRVGLVVVVALAALLALMGLATGGPGFLAKNRSIDVVFRDGQGIRAGSSVRIAGIDAGRVSAVDLAEQDGAMMARVRISMPEALAKKLRRDAKFTIQAGLTGQSRVNVVSSGRDAELLPPGAVVMGVETSFFDPILEQVGLGPVERNHLSHMIAETRQTLDAVGPRVRLIVGALEETASGLRQTADAVRPSVARTTTHVEALVRRLDEAGPKIEASLARLEAISGQVDGILAENRADIRGTVNNLREVLATAHDVVQTERPKVSKFLTNLDGTRGPPTT